MGRLVDFVRAHGRRANNSRPLIIELIGPAGAGKTTLATFLAQHGHGIQMAGIPKLRGWRNIPFLARNAVPLLLLLARQGRNGRRLTWRETKMMIHLNGRRRVLARIDPSTFSTVVLDHGPIYMLSALREFGPEITQTDAFCRWWDKRLAEWASYLDMVVFLDAPNSVLADRIDNRDHAHLVKGRPQHEMHDFLDRYRSSFERVMSSATARNGNLVLYRFRTEDDSTTHIAGELLQAIDARLSDRRAES